MVLSFKCGDKFLFKDLHDGLPGEGDWGYRTRDSAFNINICSIELKWDGKNT